jgi:hypothetical protein
VGTPKHFTVLIRDLHTELEVKLQVDQGTTEWFLIQKDVRQGCILSPGLFNICREYNTETAGVCDMEADIRKVT